MLLVARAECVQFGISEELKMANQELEPEGFHLFPVGLF